MREIHFHSVLRTRELELQYQIAQHEKLRKAQDAELNKSHQLTRQVSTFSQTENELRSQLNIYVEKFKQVRGQTSTAAQRLVTDIQQVEDTLNNSNDLFLTFRKEMEEMSKKTKRLEKENMQLTRKQEATNKNIFQMAEERSHSQQAIDRLTKENEKLKKLCRAMQTNGYGRADMLAQGGAEGEDDLGETDSEYDEYGEDDDGSMDAEYDEDTEEEIIEAQQQQPRAYGPVPPPPPPPPPPQQQIQDTVNGKARGQANGVNGLRH